MPALSLKYENPPRLVPPKQEGDLSMIVEETKGGSNQGKYHSVRFHTNRRFRREMRS